MTPTGLLVRSLPSRAARWVLLVLVALMLGVFAPGHFHCRHGLAPSTAVMVADVAEPDCAVCAFKATPLIDAAPPAPAVEARPSTPLVVRCPVAPGRTRAGPVLPRGPPAFV